MIEALCDYYDSHAIDNRYKKETIHYLICLTPDGQIAKIIDNENHEETIPNDVVKNGDTHYIDYRPKYIFGLELDKNNNLVCAKSKKGEILFDMCKTKTLAFLEGLDSPIINAYRKFLEKWVPNDNCQNADLITIKKFNTSKFLFCLDGQSDTTIICYDNTIKDRYEYLSSLPAENAVTSQCAITGKTMPIAKTHNRINIGTGASFVSYNSDAFESYGKIQSFNSNISEEAMRKYTCAINHMLGEKEKKTITTKTGETKEITYMKHVCYIDDTQVLFWSDNDNQNDNCDLLNSLLFNSSKWNEELTENIIKNVLESAKQGIPKSNAINIDDNAQFYIIGFKPNSTRLSIKFQYKSKFGNILENLIQHQNDLMIINATKFMPIYQIIKAIKSDTSTSEKTDNALSAKLMDSILNNTPYPVQLLMKCLSRLRVETNEHPKKSQRIQHQVRIIKAYLNRKRKDEISLGLNKNNTNQGYLCGRLFAVLQKIQEQAAFPSKLDKTIKDTYFATASTRPVLVFPRIISLAQTHLKKLNAGNIVFYNKLIQEITDKISDEFPTMLSLEDQGRFMIGYYQQYQDFFAEKENTDETKPDKDED